jgi:hypothetical protein
MTSRIFTADLTLETAARNPPLALAYGKTCCANSKVTINPFLLLLLLLPLLWLEECNLLRGWTEGEVRVDINEHAAGLTQDRVVLNQGSQMRCRVELGMVRLR